MPYAAGVVTVSREIDASPDAVWAVLADGWLYPSWVVGASRMRAVDPGWPGVGSELHHSVGVWPVLIDDTTTVVACVPRRELVLQARGWPAGEATVHLTIEERAGGCVVVMDEDVVRGPGLLIPGPVRTAVIAPRNVESLRRLAYLAERRDR
mgnify:CR=1 FL=1|jgi:uncharacterized protein YndB with AHSA1/START domain